MPKFVEGFADRLVVPEGERDVQVFDDELHGFGIRKFAPSKKFPSGKASYFVKYNVGSQQRRMTLGRVVRGNLKAMRLEASKVLAKARLGTDVAAQKRAAAGKVTVALGELIPKYLDERQPKVRPRYYAEIKRQLERDWRPLHSTEVEAVARQNVVDRVDDIAAAQGEVAADRARTALSGFYSWAIDRGYCETNPTMNIRARAQNAGRSRVLSEPELVEVWRACLDDDHGRIIRLLILTAQRKTEIGDLMWPEIDFDKREIELPAGRCKNGRTMLKHGILSHVVPLGEEALAILHSVKRDEGRDLVFGRGAGGFSGWSKAKRELDARIAAARGKARIKKPMPAWVVHDLRRSVTTYLVESRLHRRTGETYSFAQPHVVEATTNHISGHKSGVAGRYNKAAYLPERRQALELWGAHIALLLQARNKSGAKAKPANRSPARPPSATQA